MAQSFTHPSEHDTTAPAALFFALFPPPRTAARIADLARQLQRVHRLKGVPTAPDRLHCSLHRVDTQKRGPDWLHRVDTQKRGPDWAAERAREAASRVRAEAFDVVFDRTASFGKFAHHFVLFGEPGALKAFRAALRSALYYAELIDGRAAPFAPHVTLLYGGDHAVEEYPVTPIRWRVDAFELVLSVRGEGHRHLGRWALGG